jgi:hypothetical protein
VPGTPEDLAGDAAAGKPLTQPRPANPVAEEPRAAGSQDDNAKPNPSGLAGTTSGLLAGLAGQAAILTAVLVYFGWVRANATYHYFGVDLSALDFSVSDYLLHSVNVAFPMVVVIALFGVCAAYGHEQLRPSLGDPERVRQVTRRSARAGAGLAAVGLVVALVLALISQLAFLGLILLVIGAALVMYSMVIGNRYDTQDSKAKTPAYIVGSGALVLLLLAWAVTAYANYAGIKTAEQVQSGLRTAPDVIVYTSSNLSLSGPGVTMSIVLAPDSGFRFRYDGLRFLVGSGGNDFLLPELWRPGHGSVIVVPAAEPGIMVEFAAPTS